MDDNKCTQCGMLLLSPTDYHTYAACQLFRYTLNSDKVEANIRAIIEYGMRAQEAGITAEQAMRDTRLVRQARGAMEGER
jgi:hypothetical protein